MKQWFLRRFALRGTASGEEEAENKTSLLFYQLFRLFMLGIAGLGVWLIEVFFPDFFNYPYFTWSVAFADVVRFWPLFVWGAVGAVIHAAQQEATRSDYELFTLGAATSVMAGVWEEIGYRCIFICYAMIVILVMNWIFSTALFVAVVVALVVGVLYLIAEVESKSLQALGIILCAAGLWLAWMYVRNVEILIWLYEVLIWIADWTTFKQLGSVFYGTHDHLFIIGAFAANLWFRDGHKYQGLIGWVNSWYAGLVLLYATLTFGLLTAIVIHALYDLIFDVTLLARRRLVR